MNIEKFREYCLAKKGVTESFPFDSDTLVFKVMDKMFALLSLEKIPVTANLKCDPERAILLREEYETAIFEGYHMSKIHWNTVELQSIPQKLLIELIEHSYELVVGKLTKKVKEELSKI